MIETFSRSARNSNNRFQTFYLIAVKTAFTKFTADIFKTDLVNFVNGDSNVDQLIGRSDEFRNSGKDFAVVEFYDYIDSETGKNFIYKLQQLNFVNQRV